MCLLTCCASLVSFAQSWHASTPAQAFATQRILERGHDVSLLRRVNGWDGRAVQVWLEGAHRSAYPVMFGSVPAWWAAAALSDRVDGQDAMLFSAAWAGTAGMTWAGKRLLARPRPFTVMEDLQDRGGRSGLDDRSSMPSGHAALSAVSATWFILENPEGPVPWVAGAWAASVGLSRVWKGVHYPSDVWVGVVLGTGAGWLVHRSR
ncbi:MAG: phosphatase PAP2 family protein [Bacteroidetes bacterium]|nr:phosphatase PAP2 family protein [Bacteroidota bacterium]